MTRDLTEKQFWAALRRRFPSAEPAGFLGYVRFKFPGGGNISISRLNAGPRRREQLAYLLRLAAKAEEENS